MPTLTLTAVKDTYLYSGSVNQAYGTFGTFLLSYDGYSAYPCINFDFSALPANAFITSATLKIYAASSPNGVSAGSSLPVSISAITDFNESTITYSNGYSQVSVVDDTTSAGAQITVPTNGSWLNLNVTSMMQKRISFQGFMLSYYQNGIGYNQSFASRQYSGGISFAPQLVIDYSIGSIVSTNVYFTSDYTVNESNGIESPYNPTVNIGANTHHYNSDGGYDEYYYKSGLLFWDMGTIPANAQLKSASLNAKTSSYGSQRRLASVGTYLYQYNGSNEASPVNIIAQGAYAGGGAFGAATTETWFTYPFTKPFRSRFIGSAQGYYGVYLRPDAEQRDVWVMSDFYSRNSGNPPYITVTYVIPNQPPNAPIITYPPANTWINTKTPLVQWNFIDSDPGDYQSQYWIQLVNSAYNAVLADTGWLTGNVRSWQMPAGWITADGNYYLRMMVRDSSGANSGPGTGTPGDTTFYNVYFGVDTTNPTGSRTDALNRYLNASNKTASFTVNAADNVALANVRFAAWGDSGGQNDLVWYDGTNNGNGTWSRTINFAAHDGGIDQHYNVHVYAYDVAGNAINIATYDIYIDSVAPAAPTQTNGILYATSNGVSWTAFSDGTNSSGLLLTTLMLQKWNGSTWVTESGYPKSVAGLTYSFTGLTPGTQYRWGVTYTDNAGNVSALNYTTFTTNSYAISTINNLTSAGNIFNQRPKFRFTPTDANDSTLTNFQIQISSVNTFTSTIVDSTFSTTSAGWIGAGNVPSGTAVGYVPQTDIGAGTRYVRARSYDGKDWGTWSTVITFTVQAAIWATTLAADDTAISKRTIDDIRTKVNAVRQARGLAVVVWTDSTITDWNSSTVTKMRGTHLIELRQAITDIYTALFVTVPVWSTDPIIDTSIPRKGKHWIDLRNALAAAA
ncbi:DNRLRE domain-containing protein [Paenibacillus anseongense]|uniref:DNRLRE domain-containing protein n=1 Tax=Paenibacillus anseongense TaxID=2682845 RepID=UPI002DBD34FF|nr:DNRLRE domain-containing protein [Paenibacillus anseongense]MEC0269047.1 DNRLRE domain-containing protein [Paenibacillus anseongense]